MVKGFCLEYKEFLQISKKQTHNLSEKQETPLQEGKPMWPTQKLEGTCIWFCGNELTFDGSTEATGEYDLQPPTKTYRFLQKDKRIGFTGIFYGAPTLLKT